MADPTKYTPGYDYSNWQATNPVKPLPAQQVDTDFANIARSVNGTIDALADIRRSDGKLQNDSVGPDQLTAAVKIGFGPKGTWAAGVSYAAGDSVAYGTNIYFAQVSHVSSNATRPDLAPSIWAFMFSVAELIVGAQSLNGNVIIKETLDRSALKPDAAIGLSYASFDALANTILPPLVTTLNVAGRTTAGDGGDAVVIVSDVDDAAVPASLKGRSAAADGTPGMGKYLRYVNDKELSLGLFGMNLNNSAIDQSVKYQSALDSGRDLVVPGGVLIGLGGAVQNAMVANSQKIRGEGSHGSATNTKTVSGFLHLGGTHDLLRIQPSSGFWRANSVRDLSFICTAATGGNAIYAQTVQLIDLQNLLVQNPFNGIWLYDVNTPQIYNCKVPLARDTYAMRIMGRRYAQENPRTGVTLTSVGTTVTATFTAPHGISNGGSFWITGASPTIYNGRFDATVLDSTTLTYTVATAPATSPATGTIIAYDAVNRSTDALNILYCSGGGSAAGPGASAETIAARNNETIGLWLDGSVAGGAIVKWTGQSVRNSLYTTADPTSDDNYPAGISVFRMGGDFLAGPTMYFRKAADFKLFSPYSSNNLGYTTQTFGGDGIVMVEARNMDFFGGEIKSAKYNGMYIGTSSENVNVSGMNIYRNNVGLTDGDNVQIASGAKRVAFRGNNIGHNLFGTQTYMGAPSEYPIDGQAIYGINVNVNVRPGEVLIYADNDMRGNATAAVNNPDRALFPDGIPQGMPGTGPDRCDNGDFAVNQFAIANGAKVVDTRIRDRWFTGTAFTLNVNSAGNLLLPANASVYQTDTENVAAGKRAWVAVQASRTTATSLGSRTFDVVVKYGTQTRTLTLFRPADNAPQWAVCAFNIPGAETGNLKISVGAGAIPITVFRVRYGLGPIPDVWSNDRDRLVQEVACSDYIRRMKVESLYGAYGTGMATSSTNVRLILDMGRPLKSLPLATGGVNTSAASSIEGQYRGTLTTPVTGTVAFANGGRGLRTQTLDLPVTGPLNAGELVQVRSANNTTSFIDFDTGF